MASNWDWSPFAVGGATRPDSFSAMNPAFASALVKMFSSAPDHIKKNLRVGSGYRSVERQAELWDQAVKKYGSPEAARKWVAPPGNSGHNKGHAADLKYLSDDARQWAHDNASQYGLAFPLSNENWHIELAGARGNRPAHPPNSHVSARSEQHGLASLMQAKSPVFGAPPAPDPQVASYPSSVAPTVPAAVQQGIPAAAQAIAGSPTKSASDVFGMMATMGTNSPQFSPVQIQGPSQNQAMSLLQLVNALKGVKLA